MLKAIKGYKNSSIIAQTSIAAWQVIYTALYNGKLFYPFEKQLTMNHIRLLLINAPDAEEAYKEIVHRVLHMRYRLAKRTGSFAQQPSQWLDPANANGYASTAAWYTALVEKRKQFPLYLLNYKAFAEAILEIRIEPTAANFHYWRNYFAERNAQSLLNLFLGIMAGSYFRD